MTILHISKYYYPDLGGIETVAKYLAEGMTAYRNIVLCFATDGKYSEEDQGGVKVYRVPVNFSFMSQDVAFSYRKVLRKLLRQERPAAVHVHCPNPYVYPLVCSCVGKKTKVVLHWHSDILAKGLMYHIVKPFETAVLPYGVVARCADGTEVRFVGPEADKDALFFDKAKLKEALRTVGGCGFPVKTIDRADRDAFPDRRFLKCQTLIDGAHSVTSCR